MTSPPPEDTAAQTSNVQQWMGVAVLLTGTLLPPLDFFIVNLAVPSIQADLNASPALGEQIVASYAATYAVLLILGGRIGDYFGRRRVFMTGMIGFAAASALCGLASGPTLMILGRILQGLFAAVVGPQALSLIRASFTGSRQSLALGIHGSVFGLAAVIGQSLGGFLVAADLFGLGWRIIFLLNLPVVVLAVAGALWLIREPAPQRETRLDAFGALFLAGGLAGIVVPLLNARTASGIIWILLVPGMLLLALFWRRENTLQDSVPSRSLQKAPTDPMVPPMALQPSGVRPGLAAVALFYSIASFFLLFSTFQQSQGRTPLQAGLDILPLGIGFLIGPLLAPYLLNRLRQGTVMVGTTLESVGFVCFAAAVLAVLPNWSWLFLGLVGLGQGLALPALIKLVVGRFPQRFAGLGSGLVNATLQVSAAFSVAVIGGGHAWLVAQWGQDKAMAAVAVAIAALLMASGLVALRIEMSADHEEGAVASAATAPNNPEIG